MNFFIAALLVLQFVPGNAEVEDDEEEITQFLFDYAARYSDYLYSTGDYYYDNTTGMPTPYTFEMDSYEVISFPPHPDKHHRGLRAVVSTRGCHHQDFRDTRHRCSRGFQECQGQSGYLGVSRITPPVPRPPRHPPQSPGSPAMTLPCSSSKDTAAGMEIRTSSGVGNDEQHPPHEAPPPLRNRRDSPKGSNGGTVTTVQTRRAL
ncbi:uncharacterized protein LOC113977028 isoform X1 [Neopelma chrysocephalum]|uniref:uncharacterized protein LOC113977028 isoform X1 n=1 Tax=Neopelma chrysocephalum TaxID=114329 RepID=UPI000FCD094D|nr:uncharacterized protein LOC113977028 isoform X1 [Neopelma chrysocephalum]